ncbi:MAG: Hsp33 family molecular chaperone HslO [Christensenellales bacterium]|jgi:molecular chaperone Hsp33
MDRIENALLFNGQAEVSVIKINDILNELIKLQKLSNTAAAALGRAMTAGAFVASKLKNAKDKFSITINGGGPLGNIIVAGQYGDLVRGYVEHPEIEPPLKENGKLDVGFAVGNQGNITVIKDLGLKEPYVGVSSLVSGEIGEDFAYYYLTSEQQPTAFAAGVLIENGVCAGAGGVVIQPMPDCKDHIITVLEDIMTKFTDISSQLKELEPIDIINREFSHFEHQILEPKYPKFQCICSEQRMGSIIRSLAPVEVFEILKTDRKMEILCHFCNKKYRYTADEVIAIRNGNKDEI